MQHTETIRRIKLAREVLEAIPDQSINLDTWYTRMSGPERCGTIACGAGWLSLSSEFNELGLVVGHGLPNGDHVAPSVYVDRLSDWCHSFDALTVIFGNTEAANSIFAASGCSKLDRHLYNYDMSDKDLLLARIDFWLEQNK